VGKIRPILILIAWLLPLSTFAQQVEVNAYFLQDSARLGERVGYVLKVKHPEASQLIFPDSTYDFSPFVLLEKQTFISSTREGSTLDSSVYYLSNFSLEPRAYLTLPVYELIRYDSIIHFPREAGINLKLQVDSIPEEPVFKENNVYQPLEKKMNWIFVSLVIVAILAVLVVLYLIFAKRIQKVWKDYREKRRWSQFERKWKIKMTQLEDSPSIALADEVIGWWKTYMESITGLPIREWTSTEISENLQDKKVLESLRSIDMIIYAGKTVKNDLSKNYLLEVAKEKYQENLTRKKHERTVS
jgi:hypothetical protein